MRSKVDQNNSTNRASDTTVVLDDIPFRWIHEDSDIEHTPCDALPDCNRYLMVTDSLPRMNQAPNQRYDLCSSGSDLEVEVPSATMPTALIGAELSDIRRFLEVAGVL